MKRRACWHARSSCAAYCATYSGALARRPLLRLLAPDQRVRQLVRCRELFGERADDSSLPPEDKSAIEWAEPCGVETALPAPADGEACDLLEHADGDDSLSATSHADPVTPAAADLGAALAPLYQHACPHCGQRGVLYLGELTRSPERHSVRPVPLPAIPIAAANALKNLQPQRWLDFDG